MNGVEKAGAAFAVLVLGLDLYGRWTGSAFSLDLLHPNQLGAAIQQAQKTGAIPGSVAPPPVDRTGWNGLFPPWLGAATAPPPAGARPAQPTSGTANAGPAPGSII